MNLIEITSLSHPGAEMFSTLTEAQLRNKIEPDKGIFIAESPKVIRVALNQGYEPVALLCEKKHIEGDARDIISICSERNADFPVYTGSRELLSALTGYTLTRGVLCAMKRPTPHSVEEVCRDSRLTRDSCDPYNRRAVRVSMGSVFLVPWTWLDEPVNSLHRLGFKTVSMALTDRSVSIDNPQLVQEERLAIVMGTEGDGLPQEVIEETDYVARIPMSHQVDSLNVAAAAAVAFWQLRAGNRH